MDQLDLLDAYHIPRVCSDCGGVMIYKGIGEYRCEDCDKLDYDDYGKVRAYIERHGGATAVEIERAIGVSQRIIRRLLKDGRIEVSENSVSFLCCEICGKKIRSGQYCPECEMNLHRNIEAKQRASIHKSMQGYGLETKNSEGQKRFVRGK